MTLRGARELRRTPSYTARAGLSVCFGLLTVFLVVALLLSPAIGSDHMSPEEADLHRRVSEFWTSAAHVFVLLLPATAVAAWTWIEYPILSDRLRAQQIRPRVDLIVALAIIGSVVGLLIAAAIIAACELVCPARWTSFHVFDRAMIREYPLLGAILAPRTYIYWKRKRVKPEAHRSSPGASCP